MTGHDGRPGIGIVSDVVLQRHRLQVAAGKFGLEVSFSGGPDRLMDYPGFPDAALWLVTLEDEADQGLPRDQVRDPEGAPHPPRRAENLHDVRRNVWATLLHHC